MKFLEKSLDTIKILIRMGAKIPMNSCYRIRPHINTSAWGGKSFIPGLFHIDNRARTPHAEAWLGTHKDGPSTVSMSDQSPVLLGELIASEPRRFLGNEAIGKFGPVLPYLLKVLDAEEILSIQVHPSKQQAEEGFAREDLTKPVKERTYKDGNHKPEMHVPLTDFFMLHSFRPDEEIHKVLTEIGEFKPLVHLFENQRLEGLYKEIMTMDQDEVDGILDPLIRRLTPKFDGGQLNMDSNGYWACKAAKIHSLSGGHFDRGLFSVFLMNLLHLKPGQGTFQPARVPHSYLFGTTIELMAQSDNTLRAGLTPKKVDVPELLNVIDFSWRKPQILSGVTSMSECGEETVYPSPMEEAVLSRITVENGFHHVKGPHSFDTLVVLEGEGMIHCFGAEAQRFERGDCFGITAYEPSFISSIPGRSVLYRASTQIPKRSY